MFAKLSKLLVAGAMVMVAGQVQAADYFGSSWSSRPGYVANDYRSYNAGYRGGLNGLNGTNGIAVGGCYGKDCTKGSCTNCSNGSCNPRPYDSAWSQSRWNDSQWNGNRWDERSVNTLPYRSPSYLPVYRSTTSTWNGNSPFHHSLPGYGRSTWNVDRPYFR